MLPKSWDVPHESGATLRYFRLSSECLKATTRSGLDSTRTHVAFIPANLDEQTRLPAVYIFAPWTSAGRNMFNWEPFREDLPTRLSRLMQERSIPPCIMIAPDLYTDYGGSQYINSSLVGHHADHIMHELIPWVEDHLPVKRGWNHRAALGRSSGGYGALRLAMDFDQAFAAIACHAGDIGFELTYRRSLVDICTGLYKFRDPVLWISELKKQKKISGFDTHVLMMLGMAAFYSPNPSSPAGFDLPITLRNGEVIESVWQRWREHDPLYIIEKGVAQLRLSKLKCLFLDCGNKDQYYLQYGARQFSEKLQNFEISHTYTEFDDNHNGTSYRFDVSLPQLLSEIS